MHGIARSACRARLCNIFFMPSFFLWCKSPGPNKDTEIIMQMWKYYDDNKYPFLLVWANIDFIEIYCGRSISFNLFHGSLIILLDTYTLLPKVLPLKGNMVQEIPDPEGVCKHNNEVFYDAMTWNRSRVIYHVFFYESAVGIWSNMFKSWLSRDIPNKDTKISPHSIFMTRQTKESLCDIEAVTYYSRCIGVTQVCSL